jgi:hypothetical protein
MRSFGMSLFVLAVCAMSSGQQTRRVGVQLPPFEMTGVREPPRDYSLTLPPFEMTGVRTPPNSTSITLPPFEMTGERP